MRKKINSNLKTKSHGQAPKILGIQYFVLTFFWIIFIAFLITAVIVFTTERSRVNAENDVNGILNQIANSNDAAANTALYQQLMAIKYPLIDFSLMSFVIFSAASNKPVSDWSAVWNQRLISINVAYSYIFITALIAIIGLCFYITIIFKIYRRAHFEKRYHLETKFHNDYVIYDMKIYLNFVISLALIFSFFNFLSTIITLLYGVILVLVSYFFWYILKIKSEALVKHKWWKSPNFILFTAVLLIQNGYNILKVIFATEFAVDLDLILTILLPIGTITVVLTILIRNMLSTSVIAVLKAIKNIGVRLSSFRIFYYSQEKRSLEDYTFVTQLPLLIKIPMEGNQANESQAYELMTLVNETAKFFEKHFVKEKERKYMLFHLFNEITHVEEIEEIKTNVLKVEALKHQKNKAKK